MLSYSPENPPPKSRITNKRVAFPVGSSTTQSTSQSSNVSSKTLPDPVGSPCKDVLYLKACENFTKALELLKDDSIKEHIWKMLSIWQSGQFSENIQQLLTDLSTNIAEGNRNAANKDYLRLAMLPNEPLLKTYLQYLKSLADLI